MLKNFYASAFVVAAFLALALALNPSAQQHRARINAAISERNPIVGALGLGALAAYTSTYHSIGIGSYTKAGDRTVSYGAFGWVFVPQ